MPCSAAPSTSWDTVADHHHPFGKWAAVGQAHGRRTSAFVAARPVQARPRDHLEMLVEPEVREDPGRGRLGLRGRHRHPDPGRPEIGQQLGNPLEQAVHRPAPGRSSRRGRRRWRSSASAPSPISCSVRCIGGPTMRPARSPSGMSAPIARERVTEAGHDSLGRVGQGAVEVEDHQLRPDRRDGAVQRRHAFIVSDPCRDVADRTRAAMLW